MNTAPERDQKKLGPLAIIGLLIAIVLVAWLAILFVRFLPDAFMTLATLVERTDTPAHEDITLDIDVSHSTANTGTEVALSWTEVAVPGTYEFSYECAPGISLDLLVGDETIALACDTVYEFPADVFATTLRFSSARERFTDVTYQLTFVPEDVDRDVVDTEKVITVVNPDIPLAGADDDTTDDDVADTDDQVTDAEQPVRYRYVETVTYSVPKSDPNGYTDLAVTFLGAGTITHGVFTAQNSFEEGEDGAFRFAVTNIGTKTSTSWTFDATLPSGNEYESKRQDPLKPQEQAIMTVVFDSVGAAGVAEIEAVVRGGNDAASANNRFSWTIRVDD